MDSSTLRQLLERCARSPRALDPNDPARAGTDPRARDEEAWSLLIRRFEPVIRVGIGAGLKRCGVRCAPETVDETLQETYCRLLADGCRRLRGCRCGSARQVGTFLFRVGERTAIDLCRRRLATKRGGPGATGKSPARAPSRRDVAALGRVEARADETLSQRQAVAAFIARCRSVLKGRNVQRDLEILLLSALGGRTSREISQRFAATLTPSAVDTILSRTKRRLREAPGLREHLC